MEITTTDILPVETQEALVRQAADLMDRDRIHPRLVAEALERYRRALKSGWTVEGAHGMAKSIRDSAALQLQRFALGMDPGHPEDQKESIRVMARAAHGWTLAAQLLAADELRYMPEVDDRGIRLTTKRVCTVCGTRIGIDSICDCVTLEDGGRAIVVFDYLYRVETPEAAPTTKKRPPVTIVAAAVEAARPKRQPRLARSGR